METKLIEIDDSFVVRLPKSIIRQYKLSEVVEIYPADDGILIKAKKKAREGWREKLEEAIKAGYLRDDELLEGF